MGNAGHTLGHPGSFQLGVEGAVRVLKSSVTVEQRVGVRIGLYRFVKGLEYQSVVITFSQNIGCNTPVVQIQNGTKIDLVYLDAFIPLKLRHICQPFLVWFGCMEVSVKQVFGYKLWFFRIPGTTLSGIFNG